MKNIRYMGGLVLIAAVFALIIFYPLPSLLGWQSLFLKKAFLALLFCGSFCLWRIFKGPTAADRIVALDILGILILGFCAILGIPTGRDWYIDIGIAWALQSFISILALGKYLEGKHFDD
ncbi:MAG: monovalent cation/H+ antiporter complex subunit F [Candidatus Omnitrophica bacterium]|jgi:multicomponent Na+:H+ antiporter subunit F|nr:monovalent cation/H+ antiporter complex subunit F [Candidatus Omnitrophota bacterium]MDD5655211.1 monovalent cation/H+ antiporter complex subunit F [Candidatus Omnitrophota bacterium]MDD5655536.1 monovalent cation/H+ antiporter complex subunit F [Candidatus Omnitrophota bacterium]